MKKRQTGEVETLLQSHEAWCMNACSRYTDNDSQVWVLRGVNGKLTAVIVIARQSLLPVLCTAHIPPLHFISNIHSLQGKKQDVLIVAAALGKAGLYAAQNIDFDVMRLDRPPLGFPPGPAGLVIRRPLQTDMDALAALHAAYEQEEVLPAASEFNPAVSRLNTERLFSGQQMLVAQLGGRLVGKINTNAVTFNRFQIGGVYVDPVYRGLGIACRMAGEFASGLIAQGKGISLFVKKTNTIARRVYQRIGFTAAGDYRINYF